MLAELPPGLLSTAHTLQFAALSVKVLRTTPQLDHHVGPVTTTYRDWISTKRGQNMIAKTPQTMTLPDRLSADGREPLPAIMATAPCGNREPSS